MTNENILDITKRLEELTSRVKYGEVSVALKLHDGRVCSVMYSETTNTKEIQK